jgi:hypothetical protein
MRSLLGAIPSRRCVNWAEVVTLWSPSWRPAELVAARFGSAPSSGDRVHDHRVRVGPWAVAVARSAVRAWGCSDRRSGSVGRGAADIGPWAVAIATVSRSPDIRPNRSGSNRSGSNSGSSNSGSGRNTCCRAAVFAPFNSPTNSSHACCCEGASDPGLSRVQREKCRGC